MMMMVMMVKAPMMNGDDDEFDDADDAVDDPALRYPVKLTLAGRKMRLVEYLWLFLGGS